MENEKFSLEKRAIHDGICVARMAFFLPKCEEGTRMDEFYHRISESASEWFDKVFISEATADYENSEDERKKWRYKPAVFRIDSSLSEHHNKRICRLQIFVCRSGGESNKSVRFHTWDIKRDRLCPSLIGRRRKVF